MVHVRTSEEAPPRACQPGDLAEEGGSMRVHAETLMAASAEGPFEPVAVAIERDGRLRDVLASALVAPSLGPWKKVRTGALVAAAIPALMLLELDRELVASSHATPGRLIVDAVLAAFVGFELTRRTPRMPGVAAAALAAIALRWALVAARLCGKAHPAVWIAMALAGGAGALVLRRAPSRGRVALELLDRLGISRAEASAARRPQEASGWLVGTAVAVALGLPVSMFLVRRAGLGLAPEAAVFVAYAFAAPLAVRRLLDDAARPHAVPRLLAVVVAIGGGLTLTAALMTGAHHFFDAGAELARCTGKLDAEARRLLAAESAEVSQGLLRVRASLGLAVMTVAIVPLAEERIFRDLLMRVLVRKYGSAYGLFASAIVFGFAHIGIYEVALYQTVLLGLAFGLAYAEGGLIASFAVHALWNLLLLA